MNQRSPRRIVAHLTASACVAAAVALTGARLAEQNQPAPPIHALPHAEGEILVRFRADARVDRLNAAHAETGAQVQRTFTVVPNLQLVRLSAGTSVDEGVALYRARPDVLYAEPNYRVQAFATPNDPRFGDLWGLHNLGNGPSGDRGLADADIDAPEAWTITTGSDAVVVAVIDSGIDYNHEDLAANMFRNTAECTANGVDDDHNGYVDDCYGIDTFNGDGDPMDDNNHGTHVAGTIGARGTNGIGVAGVNWNIRLVACKFLGSGGFGFSADALECLDYLKRLKDAGVNLVATNNSWGSEAFSQAMLDAIETHRQRGILFVASAGNSAVNNNAAAVYPANYHQPNVISVAASMRADALARFSNYGTRRVHLAAPGADILSTTRANTYGRLSGTSMAAPHVTGVVGLLAAQDPSRDWRALKNLVLAGGDARQAMPSVTGRRLNAFGSLTCSGSVVRSRLLPVAARTASFTGFGIDLAALHINCANPNGAVTVTVSPGNTPITLTDAGTGTDQAAGDGIYSGQFVPSIAGEYTLTFPGGDAVTVSVLGESYTVQPAGFNYRLITGRSLALEPGQSGRIVPPFPVRFGGAAFDRLDARDDGVLTFEGPVVEPIEPMPTPSMVAAVAPFWMNLYPPPESDQNVFWDVVGTAPNRELVVEWRNLTRHTTCGDDAANTVRFQVVFFESSSNVLVNYADATFGGFCDGADGGGEATIGIQTSAHHGATYSYRSPGAVSDGTALLWTAGTPSPATPLFSVTPSSHGFGHVLVGQSEERTFKAQNLGGGIIVGTVTATPPFTVVSGHSYTLTAGSSHTVTIRYSPTAPGDSDGTAVFSHDAAGGTATVELSGTGLDSGCAYSISPTGQSVSSSGGTFSVSVTASPASCSWTATSHAQWIAITSGASGTGNGSLAYAVAANTAGSRTATLTVAGKTLTVTQANGGGSVSGGTAARPDAEYAADRILVRFRPEARAGNVAEAHAVAGAVRAQAFTVVPGLQVVQLPPGLSVSDAVAYYTARSDVVYAEPDYVVRALGMPNDARVSELWGLHNTGAGGGFGQPAVADADIDAPEAWDLTTGSASVVVGILDTGIDYTHPDLILNVYRNESECTGNGVDDDRNGYVDDCHGIDPVNQDSDPFDDNFHGTHVAGTIGARGDNGIGVVGVTWTVKMVACKILNAGGTGSVSRAVECLEYLGRLKDRGVNLVATNNSWGGGSFSQSLFDAIDGHRRRGILFVAAAGNDAASNSTGDFYPADYFLPNVVSVAGSTRTDSLGRFSNYGRQSVHLAAPGLSILSTMPNDSYAVLFGTSMAAPHVTGVAALLAAQTPSRDWRAIRNLILAGGDRKPMATITQRRLNARGALACSSSVVLARLKPVRASIRAFVGEPTELSVLHINCGTPNGNLSVTAGDGQTITLGDEGTGGDQASGDGTYTGTWIPALSGTVTLSFPGGDTVTAEVLDSSYSPQHTTYNYRAIDGVGTRLQLVGRAQSVELRPPLAVHFGGRSFSSFFVDSRGLISFDAPVPRFLPLVRRLPRADLQTLVAPFWDELFLPPESAGQDVYWAVVGASPNRELVIEWRDVTHFTPCGDDAGNTIRFQVVFHESSADILFNYADTVFAGLCGSSDRGGTASIGIQSGRGHGTHFSSLQKIITGGQSILWTASTASVVPSLSIDPFTSHEFGLVPVGGFEDRAFRVTNMGGGTLTGTAVMNPGAPAEFRVVSGASFSLSSGASQDVIIRFAPVQAHTALSNIVRFTSNGGDVSPFVDARGTVSHCDYTLSAASVALPGAGGSGQVNVTSTPSGCTWAATSMAPWISVSAGSTGTGSSSVAYSVDANAGALRTGSITIAGVAFSVTQAAVAPPTVTLTPSTLNYGTVNSGGALQFATPAQTLTLTQAGAGAVTWTASANQPWITVSPASGTGSGILQVSIQNTGKELPPAGLVTGTVTVTATGASNSPTATVNLTVLPPGTNLGAFGSFGTPADQTTGAAGSIPVTGWALDDVEVVEVQLWRDPHPGDPPAAIFGGPGPQTGQVFIGYGTFVDGARPDVEAFFPTMPRKSRAGWGYLMLTRGLIWDGHGAFKLYAYAVDREGQIALLGAKTLSIDNSASTKPFGAIDTPGQGATAGGLYPNTGWVLTPGAGATISAANVQVAIDGVFVSGLPSMSDRADITGGFAGFNTSGAGRGLFLDLSTYADGTHTIGWLVTDSLGRADGIGSRFFTVSNGASLTAGHRMASAAQIADATSCRVSRDALAGWPASEMMTIDVDELARIERRFDPRGGLGGYAIVDGDLRALPVGSHLDTDTGVFTWQLGPGFLGRHHLVFVSCAGGAAVSRQDVTVTIAPKIVGDGVQVAIDTPRPMHEVTQPFTLAGWSIDRRAADGTGVGGVMVWAYPQAGGRPLFLGFAAYGGARPDVAALYGDRFRDSGFGLDVAGLPPGVYDLAIVASREADHTAAPRRTVRVLVR